MGLGLGDLQVMIKMKLQGFIPDGCAVAEIGAQQLGPSFLGATTDIESFGRLFGAKGKAPLPQAAKLGSAHDSLDGYPYSREFWRWLGLDYTAIDVDGSPGAVPLDLNFDEAPADLRGKFAFVSNLGTTEHLINQMQAMKIIHDLTAVGGVMMHVLPTQGMINHGFFLYHPSFFFSLGRSNGYKLVYASTSKGQVTKYPASTAELMTGFDPDFAERHKDYAPIDSGMTICLVKQYDTEYVPPLDIKTGSKTDIKELAERYWSVFSTDPFLEHELKRAKTADEVSKQLTQRELTLQAREQAAAGIEEKLVERERIVVQRERAAGIQPQRIARPTPPQPGSFSMKVRLWLRWKLIRLLGLNS